MAVTGSQTTENGDAILISLEEPYKNVVEVVSFSDVVEGETTDCFYNKSFRWGIDGVSYSDYVPLTDENLNAILLDPNNNFWIQYKYEQVGDCTLEFKSISLEVVTADGVICKVPQIEFIMSKLMSIFKDSNDINEKTIVGFSSFAVMVIFAIADIISGTLGKDLIINEFIYNSFLIITLGSFGIAEVGKIANLFKKDNNENLEQINS